jgi:hypothetical protein
MPALAAPLVAASLLLLALVGVASADKCTGIVITGRVYCDPCRTGFDTNVSHSVEGTDRSDDVLACQPWRCVTVSARCVM